MTLGCVFNMIPFRCTKRRLIIFVGDLNDNAPICENANTVIQVSESEEIGKFRDYTQKCKKMMAR